MSYKYRADLVSDTAPDHAIRREFFTARHDQAAARKAVRLLRPHVTAPDGQYADLWVRDPNGGTSAEFVDTISLAGGTR